MFKTQHVNRLFVLLAGLGLFGFSMYKAAATSFTHDESYSYNSYVHQSFMDIVSYKTPFTNNHILNSVGMKYAEVLFGSSELALRLPNLLAMALYLVFSFLMLREVRAGLVWPFFVVLTFNPYLLDFFGLARGYGLSIGFMAMSLYFLIRYQQNSSKRDLILFNLGAFLAILSNFALINYYAAALAVFYLLWFLDEVVLPAPAAEKTGHSRRQSLLASLAINLSSVAFTVLVIYEPFRKIMKHGFINFGGQNGFLKDTVESSLVTFFYQAPLRPGTWSVPPIDAGLLMILKLKVVFLVYLVLAIILFHLLRRNRAFFQQHQPMLVVNFVLLLIVLETLIQFHAMGTQFLKERFALFLVPLFLWNVFFLLDYIGQFKPGKLISTAGAYLVAGLFVVHFFNKVSVHSYLDWKYDMATKRVIEKVMEEKRSGRYEQIGLAANWLFSPTLNFYRRTLGLNWLNEINPQGGLGEPDQFYYEFREELEKQNLQDKEILFKAEVVGAELIRVK